MPHRAFHDLLVDFTEYVVLFQFGQAHGGDGAIQRQIRKHLTRQPLYHRSGFRVIAPGIEVAADVRVIVDAILGIAEPFQARRNSQITKSFTVGLFS